MDMLANLLHALERLPGLGKRSSERIAIALANNPDHLAAPLIDALTELANTVCTCSDCGTFTTKERNPCIRCTDPARDSDIICVVEEPADIATLERSGAFRGHYHALMGKISPARRTAADDLRLEALFKRVAVAQVTEIILALSTDLEGDATAHYITERLKPYPIRITRLAFGLPADSGIAYSDPLTLKRALQGRYAIRDES